MPWENRGQKSYYYRAKKVRGKVIHTYCGTGERAELEAEKDARLRAQREEERRLVQAQKQRWTEILNTARPLDDLTTLLVRASLYAAGFHEQTRHWRQRQSAQHQLQFTA